MRAFVLTHVLDLTHVLAHADNAVEDGSGLEVVHGEWTVHMGSQQILCPVSPVVPFRYNVKTVKTSQWLAQT